MLSQCSETLNTLKTFNSSLQLTSELIITSTNNQLSPALSILCRTTWWLGTPSPMSNRVWTFLNSNTTRIRRPLPYISNNTSRLNLTRKSAFNRLKIKWFLALNYNKYQGVDSLNLLLREHLEALDFSNLLTDLLTLGTILRLTKLKATLARVHNESSRPLYVRPRNNNKTRRILQLKLTTELISPVKLLLTCPTFSLSWKREKAKWSENR